MEIKGYHEQLGHECMDLSFIQPNVDIVVSLISCVMPTYIHTAIQGGYF